MAFVNDSFWDNGPRPGSFHATGPRPMGAAAHMPVTHTTQPTVTGSSVLGFKFDGGVVIAADTCASYGSMAKLRTLSRLKKVGANCVIGAGGDMADFDALGRLLDSLLLENTDHDDGHELTPKAVHSFVTRVMYNKRSKFEPLWNTVVIGGMQGATPFLGYVDKIGVAFTDDQIASGFGMHVAMPLLRAARDSQAHFSEAEALAVIRKCMEVLYYRDGRSLNRFEIAVSTAAGTRILPVEEAPTTWQIATMVRGYE